jgi:hypothetical protein
MDIEEQYYPLVCCWIIGTYIHKQFPAYPYLFFNAMKGSGKTRLLKIIANLTKDGKVAGSMTEAVLFRTARLRTLCIDELESINAKGNENLKLLLNSAYKRGTCIERMTKKKVLGGEEQVVESFEVYCPICMANIWGMENVLGDRCISLILEKSSKSQITKLIENFEFNMDFQEIRGGLKRLTEGIKDESNIFGGIYSDWNSYVKNIVNDVSIVSNVSIVNDVSENDSKTYDITTFTTLRELFKKINDTNLSGRDLELFFPLFIIADMCSPEILEKLLNLAQIVVKAKKEGDREENRDVQVIEFIAQSNYIGFIPVLQIIRDMQEYYGEEEKWINSRGISRALKRLKLVLNKGNTGKNRTIKLDISKAQEKLLMFKEPELKEKLSNFTDSEIKSSGWTQEELEEALKDD